MLVRAAARTPRSEAGARTLNCGWISCCFAASSSLHLCPMRRPIAIFATCDDLAAGVCRQIKDHRLKRQSSTPHWWNVPPAPAAIPVPQARWIKQGSKSTLGYEDEIQRLCPPGRSPERGKFHRQGPHGASANRAGSLPPGFIPWSKGRTRGRVWPTGPVPARPADALAWSLRYRDGIICEQPPVINPCVLRKNAGAG